MLRFVPIEEFVHADDPDWIDDAATPRDFALIASETSGLGNDRRCFYCGAHPLRVVREHVTPRIRGGSDSRENLVWSCVPCNQAKGTLPGWLFVLLRVAGLTATTRAVHKQPTADALRRTGLRCAACDEGLEFAYWAPSADGQRLFCGLCDRGLGRFARVNRRAPRG